MMNPVTPKLWESDNLQELLDAASERYLIEFTPVSAGGKTLQIAQIGNMHQIISQSINHGLRNAIQTLPLWAKIWPSSILLGHCMTKFQTKNLSVLEIGAGCGVAGLIAAAHGFSVCLSDINEDALLFTRINILKNKLVDQAVVRKIDLHSDSLAEKFPIIIGAELLYIEQLFNPLVSFLEKHLAQASAAMPDPQILLAADKKRPAKRFFSEAKHRFNIFHKQISLSEKTPAPSGERYALLLHKLTPLQTPCPPQAPPH